MEIEDIARVCHEANRAYCIGLEDDSQVPWDIAPGWQRESAIEGVKSAQAGAGPRESHEGWMAQKARDGWVWGSEKDPEAKRHPCLVDYDELPPEQRVKDHLFVAIVGALSARVAELEESNADSTD